MLSSVLHSRRAIAANILIMRTFVQLRRAQGQYAELRGEIAELTRKIHGHDELLDEILSVLEALAAPSAIAFVADRILDAYRCPASIRPRRRISAR